MHISKGTGSVQQIKRDWNTFLRCTSGPEKDQSNHTKIQTNISIFQKASVLSSYCCLPNCIFHLQLPGDYLTIKNNYLATEVVLLSQCTQPPPLFCKSLMSTCKMDALVLKYVLCLVVPVLWPYLSQGFCSFVKGCNHLCSSLRWQRKRLRFATVWCRQFGKMTLQA